MYVLIHCGGGNVDGEFVDVPRSIERDNTRFVLAGPSQDEVLFYDWWVDEARAIVGLELHTIGPYAWHNEMRRAVAHDASGFIQIPIKGRKTLQGAMPAALEAFGDVHVYKAEGKDQWLVLVGVDDWLDERLRGQLLSRDT